MIEALSASATVRRQAWETVVNVLILGAGVIESVYGAHLGAAGHTVSVINHGPRTSHIASNGLQVRDLLDGQPTDASVDVVNDVGAVAYDLVLVAVRRDHLAPAAAHLTKLTGQPTVLFLGNNPAGRTATNVQIPGRVFLGFPGIGGTVTDGQARYVRIPQQPTALPVTDDPHLADVESTLRRRGFAVQRVADMDGWLAYHAAFVACIAAALYRCGTDPVRLAGDRPTLNLMCRAVTEGFAALRAQGVAGLPRNLAVLHHPMLRPIAVTYWSRTMRSPMGELCFAAHARHAEPEMRALGDDTTARLTPDTPTVHLRQLLQTQP
jgi:ketopantoate reductase